jgi:hypothetical protein
MNELIRQLIDQVARRRKQDDETVTDQQELGRRLREGRELVFVGGVFFVEKFAYFAERTLLEERVEGGKLFVGFELFRNMTDHPERRQRYLELDRLANSSWAYGWDEPLDYGVEPPAPWPFARAVPVRVARHDPLCRCWFVVYTGPQRCCCLVALREVGGEVAERAVGQPKPVSFRGVWTTDEDIAGAVAADLLRVVNPYYGVVGDGPGVSS